MFVRREKEAGEKEAGEKEGSETFVRRKNREREKERLVSYIA